MHEVNGVYIMSELVEKFVRNHDWLPQGWARLDVDDVYFQNGKHWKVVDIDLNSFVQFVKVVIREV
jgi:hypothetical protein